MRFEDEKEFSWQRTKGDDNDDAEEEVNSNISITNARRRLFDDFGHLKGRFPPPNIYPRKPDFKNIFYRNKKNYPTTTTPQLSSNNRE